MPRSGDDDDASLFCILHFFFLLHSSNSYPILRSVCGCAVCDSLFIMTSGDMDEKALGKGVV